MFTEDQFLPLSALQHLLFCPRQTALIHLEQAWAENRFTAEGKVLHKRAHDGPDESRPGVRITRSLAVSSAILGLSGQCDIVEFHQGSVGVPPATNPQVIPIEYKRGKPKSHQADEVQLCAQALCLEEMLHLSIPHGFLFYGQRKRRSTVPFDASLRQLTTETAQALHALIDSRATPPALYEPQKCDCCSLIHHCQPKSFRLKRGAASWFQAQIANNQ